jgi:hypothetical protein
MYRHYRMRKRAESQDQTRRRIVEAAMQPNQEFRPRAVGLL